LIEASLELIDSRKIIAIQDMGAAGLTSSSAEMASRGEVGVELDVSLVPTREPDMSPYEILLSESQERMLVVAPPENVADIKAIAGKWELDATAIGSVTGDGLFRVKWGDAVVAEIPGEELVGGCPLYDPDAEEDAAIRAKRNDSVDSAGTSPLEALEKLLLTPSIASKRWVYEQYDSTVQASSVIEPGGGGGGINIPGTRLGIAAATDCNSRHVLLDPYEGAKGAVAEAARNVACTGATPIGITNCLNFGSPEKPGVFYQFKEVCRGIADACTALGTPVTGGNVSFYNESPSGAVPPTPLIGMIGVLDDVSHAIATAFRFPGDTILLLGETAGHLGGSSLWAHVFGATAGEPPRVNLASEQNLIRTLTGLAASRLIRSANDLSDGGLVIALCESCFGPPYRTHALGATIRVPEARCEPMEFLFGEDHARALVSCAPEAAPEVTSVARGNDVAVTRIGVVGDPNGNLEIEVRGERITDSIVRLRELYEGAIPGIMRQTREVQ
ncbi:MAG: AIR synthase-related protein, partial [Gemmatimonadales bacterium]